MLKESSQNNFFLFIFFSIIIIFFFFFSFFLFNFFIFFRFFWCSKWRKFFSKCFLANFIFRLINKKRIRILSIPWGGINFFFWVYISRRRRFFWLRSFGKEGNSYLQAGSNCFSSSYTTGFSIKVCFLSTFLSFFSDFWTGFCKDWNEFFFGRNSSSDEEESFFKEIFNSDWYSKRKSRNTFEDICFISICIYLTILIFL